MDELTLTYNAEKKELTIFPMDASRLHDITEVVRCKACVWCEYGKDYAPYCNHPTDGMRDVYLDDFCSYGERKDNV